MGDATVIETAQVDDLIQQVATLQQQLAEIREQLAEKETLLDKAQYHLLDLHCVHWHTFC